MFDCGENHKPPHNYSDDFFGTAFGVCAVCLAGIGIFLYFSVSAAVWIIGQCADAADAYAARRRGEG